MSFAPSLFACEVPCAAVGEEHEFAVDVEENSTDKEHIDTDLDRWLKNDQEQRLKQGEFSRMFEFEKIMRTLQRPPPASPYKIEDGEIVKVDNLQDKKNHQVKCGSSVKAGSAKMTKHRHAQREECIDDSSVIAKQSTPDCEIVAPPTTDLANCVKTLTSVKNVDCLLHTKFFISWFCRRQCF